MAIHSPIDNTGIVKSTQAQAEAGTNDSSWMSPLKTAQALAGFSNGINDFRLTLTTATPVTTADVSAAGTIYMTPYKGNNIALYTGSAWTIVESAELSVAASTTGSKVFDIFLDYNDGTPALATTDWTNDTTRATALAYQDGILCKTGDLQMRYLGTARTKTASQVDDAVAFRHLWNYYNRVKRPMRVFDATASWDYTLATIQQARASTANQLDFVIGVAEDTIDADLHVLSRNSSAGVNRRAAMALDSTTTVSAEQQYTSTSAAANADISHRSHYSHIVPAGRHYLAWTESSTATGTTTWYGTSLGQAGIIGSIKC